jgi:hypothetical protein
VYGLNESHSHFVLKLIANVLPIVGTDVLFELLPLHYHLIYGILLTVVEHVGVKIGANTSL